MDTPGLGDTRGQEQDEKNVRNILDTISKTEDLNAIIIMQNGAESRVHSTLKLAVEKIKGLIPNVVEENIIIIRSNLD